MEKCDICGTKLKTRHSTQAEPYRYAESGLDNVYLVGVEVFICPECLLETAAIPRIENLHKTIAEGLLRARVPLTGGAFRYLRKGARLGLPELADRMHVARELISLYELSPEANAATLPAVFCSFADKEWALPQEVFTGGRAGVASDEVTRKALEAARHELVTLHNLTVTDQPDAYAEARREGLEPEAVRGCEVETRWVTDTSAAVALIDEALAISGVVSGAESAPTT
jgi:hypothetical protein